MAETGERMVGGLGYTGRQRVAGDRRGSGIEEGRSWEQQQHDGGRRRASEIGC